MPSPTLNRQATWWLAVGLLVVIIIVFVPPGRIPYPPDSPYSDSAIAHWPAAQFFRDSVLNDGQWPFWNPYKALGQPFAANPLNKVWYPPQWLALIIPTTYHLDLLIYLHMAWLGIGVLAWTRANRFHPLTSLFAMAAWALNPKLIAHLGSGHLDIFYALAWIPWLLWGVYKLVETPSLKRGIVLGVIGALLALGDVRIAFYTLPTAAVYAMVLLLGQHSDSDSPDQPIKKSLLPVGAAGLVFLLLTAVQTVPVIALSGVLTRAQMTIKDAAVYSLPASYLTGLLIPDLGGSQEWMTYTGLPVLALAVVALWRRENRWQVIALWGVAIVAILWALGDNGPVWTPVVRLLKIVTWVRVPSRAWFVVVLCLIILNAWGMEYLLQHGLGGWGKLAAVGLAFIGLIIAVTAAFVMTNLPGTLIGSGLAMLGTGGGLWLAGLMRDKSDQPALQPAMKLSGPVVLLVTLIVSLVMVDSTLIEGRSLEEVNALDDQIIAALGPDPGMVYSPSFDLIGPAAARARLSTLQAVDPFLLRSHSELINRAAGTTYHGYQVVTPSVPDEEEKITLALRKAQPDYDLLAALGVERVVAHFPIDDPQLEFVTQVEEVNIYRVTAKSEPYLIEDEYRPVYDIIGAVISGITAVGLGVWAIMDRRKNHAG